MTNDPTQLDVFYGDLNVNRAYVYARLPLPGEPGTWSLAGQVRGPRCLHAETLPVTSPLVDMGPGPTLLARALVADPCFWSPDVPAIYDVTVNLLRGSEIVATARREIGLRALGVRGRFLSLESKRWILRGVSAVSTTATLPRQWHESAAAYVTADATDESLAEAAQFGTLTVAELRVAPAETAVRLQQLAACPGVAMVVVRGQLPADVAAKPIAPNLLLAQAIQDGEAPAAARWADLLWVQTASAEFSARVQASAALPVIICRKLPGSLPMEQARAACDVLQRDFAPVGQFAGYVV